MATTWQVPRMWQGRTVAILASGPSLLASLPAVSAAHRAGQLVAVVLNSGGVATRRSDGSLQEAAAPWADMLYGADSAWWCFHAQQALKFPGLKVTASSTVPFRDVLALKPTGAEGYDPTPGCLRTGGNSAYQATHIAAQAGAARILLCGVDLHSRNGSHHHGDHPSPLRNSTDQNFERMRQRFHTLAQPLADLGIEVFNCSPGSALTCFPFRDIEQCLPPAA
jgi:hypothetical protein